MGNARTRSTGASSSSRTYQTPDGLAYISDVTVRPLAVFQGEQQIGSIEVRDYGLVNVPTTAGGTTLAAAASERAAVAALTSAAKG